jgi:negative elongation factor C/D
MVKDAEWRNLIYQLSEQHKSCLILNFAIQRISESGYHDEIASVTSASSSFRVFHRILSGTTISF